ncbi:hypothetical protein AOLI_G00310450 [Acnodon oligacanthus]
MSTENRTQIASNQYVINIHFLQQSSRQFPLLQAKRLPCKLENNEFARLASLEKMVSLSVWGVGQAEIRNISVWAERYDPFFLGYISWKCRQDRFVLDLLLGESIVGPLGADVGRRAEFTSVHGELTLGHKQFP